MAESKAPGTPVRRYWVMAAVASACLVIVLAGCESSATQPAAFRRPSDDSNSRSERDVHRGSGYDSGAADNDS